MIRYDTRRNLSYKSLPEILGEFERHANYRYLTQGSVVPAQGLVDLAAHPQLVKQHTQIASDSNHQIHPDRQLFPFENPLPYV